MKAQPQRLRPSGGYRELRSFRTATVIYDATVSFCARFLDPRSRTVDQMTQAARSGRQNIAEGSRASATSTQTELRLVNVARGSLDELLLDYEDFLRQRGLQQWAKDSREAREVREVFKALDPTDRSDRTDPSDQGLYQAWLAHDDPAVVANTLICLIHQANYLLDRQIQGLERQFIREGGYSERLAAAHLQERQNRTDRSDQALPPCPLCGRPLLVRTARQGQRKGSQFLGCSGFPACRGTLALESSVGSVGSDRSVR
jgi:restriction system protein